jgi:methionine sulfoxide reductase heme-binding subunit
MNNALWYLGRGSGFVALILLTVVLVLGIHTRSRRTLPGLPRWAVAAVHKNAGLLAVSFLVVHVATLTLDPFAQLRLVDLLIPGVGAQRPLWLGMGTLSLDLLLAVMVTSLLRERIGNRLWRAVHWLSYAAWPTAFLHTIGDGSDGRRPWALGITLVCLAAVAGALCWRLSTEFERPRRLPGPRAAGRRQPEQEHIAG